MTWWRRIGAAGEYLALAAVLIGVLVWANCRLSSKQEWIALWQAIGSLSAIWISTLLWRKSSAAETKRLSAAAKLFAELVVGSAQEFVGLVEASATEEQGAVERKSHARLFALAQSMIDVAEFGLGVDIARLPKPMMLPAFKLRTVVARMRGRVATQTLNGGPPANIEMQRLQELQALLVEARSLRAELDR